MIQVRCPSCAASYGVNEARLPAEGLSLQCPTCAENFVVCSDGSVTKLVLSVDSVLPQPYPEPSHAPQELSSEEAKPRISSTGPSAGVASSQDLAVVDLPAPRPETFVSEPVAGVDLPAVKQFEGSIDLPAPHASSTDGDFDHPVPPIPSSATDVDLDLLVSDLPMVLSEVDLPVFSDAGPSALSLDSDALSLGGHLDLPKTRSGVSEANDGSFSPPHGESGTPSAAVLRSSRLSQGSRQSIRRPLSASFLEMSTRPPRMSVERISFDGGERRSAQVGAASPEFGEESIRRRKNFLEQSPSWLIRSLIALIFLLAVIGVGWYLKTTKYGPFGIHAVESWLPRSGSFTVVAKAIQDADRLVAADTYAATQEALWVTSNRSG